MLRKHLLQGRILLHQECFPCGVDAIYFVGRRFIGSRKPGARKHHQHRHRLLGVRGRHQGHMNVNIDGRVGGVVHLADDVLGDHGSEADHLVIHGGHRPGHLGYLVGHASIDILREHLEQFGSSLIPPHLRRGDLAAVVHSQRVGNVWEGVGLRFVIVGVVGRLFIAARPWAQRLDPELIHHVLMVLIGGKAHRGRCCWSLCHDAAANCRHAPATEVYQEPA